MYKISEQQVNPEVLSVAKSYHYNKNVKKWQTSFIDKCPPLAQLPNKFPPPRATAWMQMQKPQGEDKVLMQIPGVARGEGRMVMDEIDTCINFVCS